MATILPHRYPVDLTGESTDNLIIDEPHSPVRRKVRCIAPMYAPFFKDSMQVYEVGNAVPLIQGTQYKLMNLIPLPTAMAGGALECYALIAIIDESVGDNLTLDYQTVGGEFVQSFEAALSLLEALSNDTRPATWPNVIDRPLVYPADLHLHAVGDVIGWEYVSVQLQQVREAVINGDARDHEAILTYIDAQTAAINNLIALQSQPDRPLGAHLIATNNPHNVTKDQVGLGLVQNFPLATEAEASAGTALNRYMTPALVTKAIENVSSVSIGNHPLNTDNPHQTTKDQVGLGNVPNYPAATNAEGIAGTAADRLMTPAATKVAIQAIVDQTGETGEAHIADMNNPHATTKDQVGLGNVQNYGVATIAQTVTGTAADLYTTPAGVKGAMDAVKTELTTLITNHTNRTDNPHVVTKAQVGLGFVENYPPATNAEAVTGTAVDRYMTPASMKAALEAIDLDVSTKVDADLLGAPNGVAPLNAASLIEETFLLNAPGANVRDMAAFVPGRPPINSVIARHVVTRPLSWGTNWLDSLAYVAIAPDAEVVINLRRNTDAIGTITFAAASQTGVFAGVAGNAVAEDVIEMYYNGTGDTTLADLVINLLARAYVP